jgi:glycosyltransferase involved in cell wall biosynthesis
MVRLASLFDVGLAPEPGRDENNRIALSNKIFTYLLAGNAVVATATDGQRQVMEAIGEAGFCYAPADVGVLAGCLRAWFADRGALERARRRAWEWGTREYNWEREKEKFLRVVEEVLGPRKGHPPPASLAASLPDRGTRAGELAGARILVIMPSIPILGMERSTLQIMRMMRERGADVRFVTHREYGRKVGREAERIGCSWRPVSLDRRLHLARRPGEMVAVLRAWVKAAWQIDSIYRRYRPTHIYVTNFLYFLFALPTLWRARQPIVFRLPNPPDTDLLGVRGALSRWLWRYLVAPASDVLVCNSRYTLSRLERIGVTGNKARVIYNCLPERPRAAAGDAPKVDPCQFNVVYLGQIRPGKGVRELFDVALRLVRERGDVSFYLVGEHKWQNPFAEGLLGELRERDLVGRINILDEIEDVGGLLAQCDLHVCPSVSPAESFPNVVLEAKSQGVPSVVFPTAGLPESVTHLVDGYVCRDTSLGALYDGIRYFLDDPESLKLAGEAARRSLERFPRERIADQWAEVFKAVRV